MYSKVIRYPLEYIYITTRIWQENSIDIIFIAILGWGSHYDNTDVPYITAAAAIGMTHNDINLFIKRLDKVLAQKNKELSTKRQEIAKHIEKNRILQPQSLNAKTFTQV